MAKPRPKPKPPFDIFGDERLEAAMTAATTAGEAPDSAKEEDGTKAKTKGGAAERARVAPSVRKEASGDAPEEPEPVPTAITAPFEIGEHVALKFEVPRSMRSEFQAFKAELSAALGGVALDNSNIGRALIARLLGPERGQVLAAASARRGEVRRPKSDDSAGMGVFDAELLEVLEASLKR